MYRKRIIRVVTGIIKDESKVLIMQRLQDGELWELPTGVAEPMEFDGRCMRRVLFEQLNIKVKLGPKLGSYRFEYNENHVEMNVYYVSSFSGTLAMYRRREAHWIEIEALPYYDMPEAHKKAAKDLLAQYQLLRKSYFYFFKQAYYSLRWLHILFFLAFLNDLHKGRIERFDAYIFAKIEALFLITAGVAFSNYRCKTKQKNTHFVNPDEQ